MLTKRDLIFIDSQPVARLATADGQGAPHVVPVCFAVIGESLYVTIDGKPKQGDPRRLKRLDNIAQNPQVAVIVDRYDADWSHLGWVMLRGRAEIIESGDEHGEAQAALKLRYPQYHTMSLHGLPVIALRIERVTRWGDLGPDTA